MRSKFLLLVALCTCAAHAQSTAFTYQGELKNGAQLASGLHDFRFRLFNAQTNGAQIGTTLCVNNVSVADGKFATTIDFGAVFATPDSRFIELEARRDTGLDCSNATGFTITGPRQPLTATPIALHSRSASALVSPAGSPVPALSVDNDGRVGLGTTAPAAALHIRQFRPSIILQDSGVVGTPGAYVSFFNNSAAETGWFGLGHPNSPIMSVASTRPSGHLALLPGPGGNVGIGTLSPVAKLDVRGDIRMGATGQQFAVRPEENVRVLRGEINSAGTVIRGTGFTCSRIDVGKYRIVFTTGFSNVPTVSATAWRGSQSFVANMDSITSTSATIVTYDLQTDNFADGSFDFLMIGPR